jgi:phosphopantetheinyl transferase
VDDGDVDVWCGAVSAPDRRLALDARRAATREVLADYVALPAAALAFDRSCEACGHPSHGKPRLVGSHDLSFNVAGRDGRWMVAVARGAMSIGVDLERVDGDVAVDLHATVLTAAERDGTDVADAVAVTRLWCRKEAVLKARGVGLGGQPPDTIDVRDPVAGGWHLGDLDCPPGWVAAVAAAAPFRRIAVLEWSGTPGGR